MPTGSSRSYLIEVWFSQLANRAIRRGSFAGVGELVTAIHGPQRRPKPVVWTASVGATTGNPRGRSYRMRAHQDDVKDARGSALTRPGSGQYL